MKEKRILAMFITSAVTLVASLAITFGVFMTLADPVVATGITRYNYSFNAANNSLITVNGRTLKLTEEIVYQPSSSVIWPTEITEETVYPVWFNDTNLDGSDYEDEIVYKDESISTKIKVVPLRISNNYTKPISVRLNVSYNTETLLGKYTKIKIYDYTNDSYENLNSDGLELTLPTNGFKDLAVIVFTDDSTNFGRNTVNWGVDYQKMNVIVTNTTLEL